MHRKDFVLTLVACALLLGAATGNRAPQDERIAPLPASPALEAVELVDVVPFSLDEAFVHEWRSERPTYSAGFLVVLRADPAFLRPRQVAEPVLYVGSETAERLNDPSVSGHLVALVPVELDSQGLPVLDPREVPIWFGSPELPERVDARRVRAELDAALRLGAGPLPFREPSARRKLDSSGMRYARDRAELELVVADLVEEWSPNEVDLIAGLRVPLTR